MSYKIMEKVELAPNTVMMQVHAPLATRKMQPGQFIIVRVTPNGERIPLSISGWDMNKGTVRIIVQAVGRTSAELIILRVGDSLTDVVGPLGQPSHLDKYGTCVLIGGGYGTGAIIPIAKDLKARGNKVIGIIGARTKELVLMENELRTICDKVEVSTNDGSQGVKGLVTDVLTEILKQEPVHMVTAIGPVPMMKAVSEMTRPLNIKTYVSLNAIMVDGTGMCGSCRVEVGGTTKFACIDGPDFDGHQVNFGELVNRQKMYIPYEKKAMELHLCKEKNL
ncbi:MAG TPA: sulfide/dihydroorotate dehydrogenase-like FAD/NAD-binding protein [Nitrospiraceae bacterium]|nr:MAG: ferredoxin-NADP reductase [Nitrospirae bacterium GWA2_42_11]OGW56327.1 MAG: ferredoxin-NADP reductase [Nitrospirae bacterium RIFCSPHIGHO2_02_FULL_42_12]HBI23810.1 sulfide/dihydroorotate dehydrogenase-like FAD/NAD-binding protein [Nitrospiraceae bacterium]